MRLRTNVLRVFILIEQLLWISLSCNSDFTLKGFCPVSSLIDTSVDGKLSYPIDIFDDQAYGQYNRPQDILNTTYNCTSTEQHDHAVFHRCDSITLKCPLASASIDTAITRSSQWTYKHSLCSAHFSLLQSLPVNVIILGGSVTEGAAANGCCCDRNIDSKCPIKEQSDIDECGYQSSIASSCNWVSYFIRWLRSIGSGQINVVNIAQGGATSEYMADILIYSLAQRGITKLTNSDIVFVDHSINDGMVHVTKILSETLSQGLETLIRRILHISEEGSWPSIILLEMWPYYDQFVDISHHPQSDDAKNKFDYSLKYNEVSKEYEIPVWSYRDMVWGMFDNAQRLDSTHKMDIPAKARKRVVEYLLFIHNTRFGYQHPPWFVHLFYADMIGSIMRREFEVCGIGGDGMTVHTRRRDEMNSSLVHGPMNHHIHDSSEYCMEDKPTILDLAPEMNVKANMSKHSFQGVGKFSSSPHGSWAVYSDRHSKIGWIDQNSKPHSPSTNPTMPSEKYISNLTFTFDPSLFENDKSMDKQFLIRFHYMRTYFNAGAVDVYLCGKYLTTLDALWSDFYMYKFSYPVIYTFEYTPASLIDDALYCSSLVGTFPPTLSFHRLSVPTNHIAQEHEGYTLARGRNKFKLISVKICMTKQG